MAGHLTLDKDMIDLFCSCFAKHYSVRAACAIVRVSEVAFKKWMERGAEIQQQISEGELDADRLDRGQTIVYELFHRVTNADAEAENDLVDTIANAAKTDYRAADLLLSKRHGWGVRVETKNQTQINILEVNKTDLTALTGSELAQLEELAAKAEGKHLETRGDIIDSTFKSSEDVVY